MFCCSKAKPICLAQIETLLEASVKQLEALIPPGYKNFVSTFQEIGPKGIADLYIQEKGGGKIFSYGLKNSAFFFIWKEKEKIWAEIRSEQLMIFLSDSMQE